MTRDAIVERLQRAFDFRHFIDSVFARADLALADRRVWRAAVAALLLLQSAMIITHAAWLDEWQALQIALQSPTLSDLLGNLHYEGHPPLWYLLLRSVALVVPYLWVLAITQLAVALGIQALILFRAPFGRLERLLIGGSFFILFEFGTLSRSLGLGALLTIAFFAVRDRRLAWLSLILLPMVDFLYGLLSILGVALTIRDRRFSVPGAALWLASGLFAAWSVIPAPDVRPALDVPPVLLGVDQLLNSFSALLIPVQTVNNHIAWGGGIPWGLGPAVGILFVVFAIHELQPKFDRALFLCFLGATAAFRLFVYPLALRHLALLPLLLILFKWREVKSGAALDPLFRVWLGIIALCGAGAVAISIDRPFDSAPRVAEFIQRNHLEGKHWVSFPDSMAQPVMGLMDREAHTLGKGCTQSFLRWDFRDGIKKASELDQALKQIAADYGRFYLISKFDTDPRMTVPMRQIAHFPEGYDQRPYYLYIVAPDLPESARRPPPCPPRRIRLSQASLFR